MEIFKLFGSILVDSDEAEKSISRTGEQAEGLSTKLGKGIATAAKWGAGIAVGASIAVGGMAALIGKTLETTSQISKFAQVTGMSTKGFQQWDSVAKTFGFSMEAAAGDMAALAERAMDASSGVGENAEMFDKLGVSVTDSSGKLKTQEQLFNDTIKGLQGMEDVTERNAIATAMLSTTGEELAPVLNMTNEELAKMKANAGIISDEDLKKSEDFRIKWENVKSTFGGLVTEVGMNLMPMFSKVLNWVTENMPQIKSTAKTAMDEIGTAVKSVGGYIKENIIPSFQALWDWIQPNIPAIKEAISIAFEAIEVVFGKVKDAVKLIADNMNILLPIVLGLTGAVVAQMIINSLVGAYKAWQAATKTQTALQWLLNIALNANPLRLVALAIGAVIAIGILLWKNWDTIKAKTIELWKMVTEKFNDIKTSVVNKVNELKVAAVSKFVELVRDGRTKFNDLKSAIMSPIESARDRIKGVIATIKGYFTGLKLKLPNIKTPHFKFSNWSVNPLDWVKKMPSIGIDWYKDGGVFTKPTIFNTPSGYKGVAEAGDSEAVLPLNDTFYNNLAGAIVNAMGLKEQNNNQTPATIVVQSILDGRLVGHSVADFVSGKQLNSTNLSLFMKGVNV